MWTWVKHNPVAAMTVVVVALGAFITEAGAAHILSPAVLAWLGAISAAISGVLGVIVHKASTSLADPRDANGQQLVTIAQKAAALKSAQAVVDATSTTGGAIPPGGSSA